MIPGSELPQWLSGPPKPGKGPNYYRSRAYYTALFYATPPWYRPGDWLKCIREARRLGMEVDHTIPIKSPLVCGLHCPDNWQFLPADTNRAKSNHIWPGHPCEPLALDLPEPSPQLELNL